MKKVTLRAAERLIRQARHIAKSRGKTLDAAFREWLLRFTAPFRRAEKAESLMKRLRYVRAEAPYTRDEMHER